MAYRVIPCQTKEWNTPVICISTGYTAKETAISPIVRTVHRRRAIGIAIAAFDQMIQSPPPRLNQRSLGEFMLTAYAIDPESTGKQRTAPDFGITASGSRAVVGRTVAVDPRVIPIGTPVYIEGIGWRLAEDVGGAVKGRHIDVLLSSEPEVSRFGVKRHVRVFVADPDTQAE